MKAIVLEEFGDVSHFKLKEVPLPEPGAGEVRVRLKATGFNPVDFKARLGMLGGKTPRILGTDCSGIIDAVGKNVKGFSVNDEVFAMTYGRCSNGSYAEYLCIRTEFIAKKPRNINFLEAAALPLATMTAYRAMVATSALKKDGSIFIAGVGGGVGSMALQFARLAKTKAIYTVAKNEDSLKYLIENLNFDRNHILIYEGLSVDALQEKLIYLNHGKMFDATFDFVGQDMKKLCFYLTNYSGHFSTILPEPEDFNLPVWPGRGSPCFKNNLSLHFINVGAESHTDFPHLWPIYHEHLNHIVNLIEQETLHLPTIRVMGELSVETVSEAHRQLESGRTKGKLVMKI